MITQERAKTIANCFAMTGFKNKSEALIKAGYKPSYANCGRREVVYKNVHVMKEIKALQDAQSVKTGYSVEQAQAEYEEARALAIRIKQPSAAAANIMGKCRLHGFDKDNSMGERTVIVIGPKSLPDKPLPKQIESEVVE